MVRALNLNLVPSQYGDVLVQSLTSRVMLMEYLGYADAALALALPGPGLAMPPVLALANERQQAAFFAGFHSDAPRWGAFAITDCGSDATAMRTSARKTAHGWVLNGTKCFTTNGARANTIITFATINRNAGRFGIRAFRVEHDAPGSRSCVSNTWPGCGPANWPCCRTAIAKCPTMLASRTTTKRH